MTNSKKIPKTLYLSFKRVYLMLKIALVKMKERGQDVEEQEKSLEESFERVNKLRISKF
jgi:hypothetical protein